MADILERHPLPGNAILDEEEVAEILRCTPGTVCRNISQEELPFCQIGKRKITLYELVADFVKRRCREGCRPQVKELVAQVEADVLNSTRDGVPRPPTRSNPS